MLLGNGIYYQPRSSVTAGNSTIDSCKTSKPLMNSLNHRQMFRNDSLSFPAGEFQTATILAVRYGGIAQKINGSSTGTQSILGKGPIAQTVNGVGSINYAIKGNAPIGATYSGTSSIVFPVKGWGPIGSTYNGIGTFQGSMRANAPIALSVTAASVFYGHFAGIYQSAMTVHGIATFTLGIKGWAYITTNINVGANPSANDVAYAVWGLLNGIESNLTPREAMKLMSAVLLGKVSGAGSNTPVFRDVNDTVDRVSAVTDSSGDRTSVTLNKV